MVNNIFCRNSKNEMVIKDLKEKTTSRKTLLALILAMLIIIGLFLGSTLVDCSLSSPSLSASSMHSFSMALLSSSSPSSTLLSIFLRERNKLFVLYSWSRVAGMTCAEHCSIVVINLFFPFENEHHYHCDETDVTRNWENTKI